MASEIDLVERIRGRLAGAGFLLGASAGLFKGWYAPGEMNLLLEILLGGLLVPILAALAGLLGYVLRLLLAMVLGREHGPSEPLDGPASLLLGSVSGAFLGGVACLMFFQPDTVRTGVFIGSALGGLLMAAAGDMADVIVRMLVITGPEEVDEEDEIQLEEIED